MFVIWFVYHILFTHSFWSNKWFMMLDLQVCKLAFRTVTLRKKELWFFALLQPHIFDLCWKIYLNSCMLLILVVYCMLLELQFLNSNIYESYRWWWRYWGFSFWSCKDNLLQLGNSSPPDAFNYYLMRMFAGTS